MQETGNKITKSARLIIRVSRHSMSFSVADSAAVNQVAFEPYIMKSGISVAANLREAFKTSELLQGNYNRAMVMTDNPVLMIPVDEFREEQQAQLYSHAFPGHDDWTTVNNILPTLNAVAVSAINKDLKLVVEDHFSDVRVISLMQPMWSYLHQLSFTGVHRKVYGYFHDRKLDIVSFDKNRFRFYNSFDASQSRDSIYFLLYVWKQLALDAENDELFVVGDIPEKEWLVETLKRYLRKTFVINPIAAFNRAPVTQIKGMPMDLMTLFIKGR